MSIFDLGCNINYLLLPEIGGNLTFLNFMTGDCNHCNGFEVPRGEGSPIRLSRLLPKFPLFSLN